MDENNNIINLHQLQLKEKFPLQYLEEEKMEWIDRKIKEYPDSMKTHLHLATISSEMYERGISCLDLMQWAESDKSVDLTESFKIKANMQFHKIRGEYRCEKLLMFHFLDLLFIRCEST